MWHFTDSSGRFVFYKLTLHRFVRMVMGPLVWTQWEKAGQEEPHWNKRQTTRVIYSTSTTTSSFSNVGGLTQEVLGLFTRNKIRIARCMHGFWSVEFSSSRLGASHYCSYGVVFGLVLLSASVKYSWPCHTEVPSKWTPTPHHLSIPSSPVRQLL